MASRSGSVRQRARLLRSEEHTSELQSQSNLVCRLLLEKKNGQSLRERQRAPAHAIVQRVALDQLEHQGRHVAGVFETVDCPDVRMIERCEQSCFAFEARHAIGVRGEQGWQELQSDVAPKLEVVSAIHLSHTTSA